MKTVYIDTSATSMKETGKEMSSEQNKHSKYVVLQFSSTCSIMLFCVNQEELSTTDKKDDPFTRRKCQPTLVTLVLSSADHNTVYPLYVPLFLQAFRESAMPEANELLQQLADAKTEEDKEAIKAVVVSLIVNLRFYETGPTDCTVPSQKRAHYGILAHPLLRGQFPAKI